MSQPAQAKPAETTIQPVLPPTSQNVKITEKVTSDKARSENIADINKAQNNPTQNGIEINASSAKLPRNDKDSSQKIESVDNVAKEESSAIVVPTSQSAVNRSFDDSNPGVCSVAPARSREKIISDYLCM